MLAAGGQSSRTAVEHSIKAESPNPMPRPQALVAFDNQGEFKADFTEEKPTQLRRTGMHAFLIACIAIVAIGVLSHFALGVLQQPTGLAYTADNVRIDPGWMERSTRLGRTERLPGPESTTVRASIPGKSQTATVAQTAPETVAPKADTAFLDPKQVPQMPQSRAAPPQTASVATAPEMVAPKADAAFLGPEQAPKMPQSLVALPQTVEQLAADRAQMAREDAKVHAGDVEILAKIPVPRPRPTVVPARKPMSVPPSSRASIPPH